ncbi:MAG: AarF/ABC1/UbiB kinase family protein [Microthrixaceae bacterium]
MAFPPGRATITRALVVAGAAALGAAWFQRRARRTQRGDASTDGAAGPPPQRVTSARLARHAEVAKMGVRGGSTMALSKVRSVGVGPERAAELRAQAELKTAAGVAEALGNMKGALMKLGQMASYLETGLPEPMREALAQLQADAPPMAPELAAQVVAEQLGRPPSEVFARWEPRPIASASIGQVHRALTHDGREVVVKVQYPGVADAIQTDLETSDVVFNALGMLFPGMDPEPIVAELRLRLSEELDYSAEAQHQRRFSDYYRGHPTISVPDVIDEHSTGRVLCSEFMPGRRWAELLEAPQAEKDLAGETIFRYVFGSIYRMGSFNGDPHPGNYLFGGPGQVTFLDYGLVKDFTPNTVADFESLIVSMVVEHDPVLYRSEVERIGLLPSDAPFSDREVVDYFGHFYDHVARDEVTTIDPEWSAEAVRRYFDVTGPFAGIMKAANLPSDWVIVQRINLGLFALLGELGATANWRRISEELWPSVAGPPATPMGEAIAEWEAGRAGTAPVADSVPG